MVSMGLIGAERAPITLTVIGSEMKDAMELPKKSSRTIKKIPGAAEVKLTSEDETQKLM